MKANDYSGITTLEQLRAVRRTLSEEIISSQRRLTGRLEYSIRIFGLGKMLLPLIKKLRTIISGTPFAKS